MTRVDFSPPRSAPETGSGKGDWRSQPKGSFDEADAGFHQQLATVAADEDASSRAPRCRDVGEAAIARWRQQQAATEASQTPAPDQGSEDIAQIARALLVGEDADAASMLSAPAADDAEPRAGDDGQPQPQPQARHMPMADILAMAGPPPVMSMAVAEGAARTMPATGWQQPAQRTEPLPTAPKASAVAAAPPVVEVVRSETHLAPVLPMGKPVLVQGPAVARRPAAAEGQKGQPVDGGKPVRLMPTGSRGPEPEFLEAQGASGQADGDAAQSGPHEEDAALAAPITTRGLPHATQPGASPVQQIADEIAANLSSDETGNVRAAPAAVSRPAALQPVKVLTIQLHPADLGTVTVRMSMKADVMDVQVEVSRRTTARLIDADRDTLTSLLRSAGYHVEALTVRAVAPSSAASSPNLSSGSPQSGPQLQLGGSQPDARPSGGRPQPEPHGHTQVPDRNSNDSEQATGNRRGAGVYV